MTPEATNPVIGFQPLLESLDGVAYIADQAGDILAVGHAGWNDFRATAGVQACAPEALVSSNVFSSIAGTNVQSVYRRLHAEVWSGRRRIAIQTCCDGPELRRQMRLSLSPVLVENATIGVLYQSLIIAEYHRPPFRFLSTEEAHTRLIRDDAPILSVCSFCARVSSGAIADGGWVMPEDYYRFGGKAEVRLSHGLCRECEMEALAL